MSDFGSAVIFLVMLSQFVHTYFANCHVEQTLDISVSI